jgi:RNA polymerase sigma-70 factor, ECF subfamily
VDSLGSWVLEDQQAVSAVLMGDTNAFAVLVERYQKPIFNLMHRMTGSHADALDLAQDTFIKAYERLDQFRIERRFFPWLYAIGINHAKNFLRRSRLVQFTDQEDWEQDCPMEPPGWQEEQLCRQLDQQRLQQALGRLPVDYREAVILRYHEECSMEDIANALELSLSGAKMRVHRALEKLRHLLMEDSHENR